MFLCSLNRNPHYYKHSILLHAIHLSSLESFYRHKMWLRGYHQKHIQMLNRNKYWVQGGGSQLDWNWEARTWEARTCDSLGLKNYPKYWGVGVLFPDILRSWFLVTAPHKIDNKCQRRHSTSKKASIFCFTKLISVFLWNMKWGHKGRGGDGFISYEEEGREVQGKNMVNFSFSSH